MHLLYRSGHLCIYILSNTYILLLYGVSCVWTRILVAVLTICCMTPTVRKDLLTTFQRLFANDAFARLDWVVIETTGLADPAPLIQSLYMDSNCSSRLRLDGVLAVVDCKHFPTHMKKRGNSPQEQESSGDSSDGGRTSYQDQGAHGGLPEAVIQVLWYYESCHCLVLDSYR